MDEHEAWLLGEPGARDPATRGILSAITTNTTHAGGELTEDALIAMWEQAKKPRPPESIIVSTAVIRKAQADHDKLREGAASAHYEYLRLRRWRWVRRYRALRRYHDATIQADALAGTFGSHFQ